MKMIKLNAWRPEKMAIQNFFFVGWSLMVIHLYVNYSSLSNYSNSIVSVFGLAFFIIKIVKTQYAGKELVLCTLLIFNGILTFWNSQDMRVLWFAIAIMAVKNVDIEKTIKLTYHITIICCALFFLAYLLGISEDRIVYLDNGNIRRGFGLGHSNMLQAYILYIISMAIYIRYEKLKKGNLIMFALFALCIYTFSHSRTGILVTIFVLIMAWFICFCPSKNLISRGFKSILNLYIIIFSMLPILYHKCMNPIFSMLNDMLTYRITQAAYFCNAYGIKLFGQWPMELTYERKYIFLDMGYVSMMIRQGLVYFLIIVGSMMFLLNKYVKEKCFKRILLLAAFIFYLGTENVATYIFMNVSMLFISELIFSKKVNAEMSNIDFGRSGYGGA